MEMEKQVRSLFERVTGREAYGIGALLNQWKNSKSELLKFMGGKLIVEKPFSVCKTDGEVLSAVREFVKNNEEHLGNCACKLLTKIADYSMVQDILNNKCLCKVFGLDNYKHGMKLSKALSLSVPDEPYYRIHNGKVRSRREFVDIAYSMLVQDLKCEGMLAISIHPLDYLTMSHNKNRWSSCHNINGGDYAAGDLSYMTDYCSLVAYAHTGKQFQYNEFGNDWKWNSKMWRQMVYVDLKNPSAIFSRHYPRHDQNLSNEVAKMVSELFAEYLNIPKKYKHYKACEFVTEMVFDKEDALHYLDVSDENSDLLVMKDYNEYACYFAPGNSPCCPICGEDYLDFSDQLWCNSCKYPRCADCGELIRNEGDEYEYEGETYCCYCYDRLNICPVCGEAQRDDGLVYIDCLDEWVCNNCRDKYYTKCDECGEYVNNFNSNSKQGKEVVCDACLREHYRECTRCWEYKHNYDFPITGSICIECCKEIEAESEAI